MSDQTETVYPDVETATRALTSDNIDYSAPIGQPSIGGQYEQMELANALPKEDLGLDLTVKEAAEQLLSRREETQVEREAKAPIERTYQHSGGEHHGERLPSDRVVSAEQAAFELAGMRDAEQAAKITALEHELLSQLEGTPEHADAQAAERIQSQPPQYQPEQPQEQPAQPAPVDDVWQNPKVIAEVSKYVDQVNQGMTAAQQMVVQQAVANAAAAAHTVFVSFPELQNVPPDQLQGVILGIERSNPERGLQIRNHINNVQQLSAQAQEMQARQAQAVYQQHRQQWEAAATQSDNAFESWAHTQDTPERIQEISSHARNLLRTEGNLSDAQLAHLWHTEPLLRSALGQKLLYMASKYSLSRSAVRDKAVRPVPSVQRPGSPVERATDADISLRDLNRRVNNSTGRDQIRAAAELVAARRARR